MSGTRIIRFILLGLILSVVVPLPAWSISADLSTVDDNYLEPDPFAEGDAGVLPVVSDPLEPVNRFFFAFNDRLYFWVVKPVARGYEALMPDVVETGVRNFFVNLRGPIRMVNNLLQGEIRGAGSETGRFLLNSTIGVAGLFDVASGFGLTPRVEDLGQTLGRYGIGNGFYICWPVFGPSSLRDSIGMAGESYLSPLTYLTRDNFESGVAAYSLKRVNVAKEKGEVYEELKKSSLDPYLAMRDAYFQYRASRVKNEILD